MRNKRRTFSDSDSENEAPKRKKALSQENESSTVYCREQYDQNEMDIIKEFLYFYRQISNFMK